MRILLAVLLAFGMLVGGTTATMAAAHKAKSAMPSGVVYVCERCGLGAARASACPVCKAPMGRVATYACMKCEISSDAPGPCPNCREPMRTVTTQYRRCSTCGYYYSKKKKACPVCARRHKLARH